MKDKALIWHNQRMLAHNYIVKHGTRCPECNTEQIQIMNYFGERPEWRCRHCKTYFSGPTFDELEKEFEGD